MSTSDYKLGWVDDDADFDVNVRDRIRSREDHYSS